MIPVNAIILLFGYLRTRFRHACVLVRTLVVVWTTGHISLRCKAYRLKEIIRIHCRKYLAGSS